MVRFHGNCELVSSNTHSFLLSPFPSFSLSRSPLSSSLLRSTDAMTFNAACELYLFLSMLYIPNKFSAELYNASVCVYVWKRVHFIVHSGQRWIEWKRDRNRIKVRWTFSQTQYNGSIYTQCTSRHIWCVRHIFNLNIFSDIHFPSRMHFAGYVRAHEYIEARRDNVAKLYHSHFLILWACCCCCCWRCYCFFASFYLTLNFVPYTPQFHCFNFPFRCAGFNWSCSMCVKNK